MIGPRSHRKRPKKDLSPSPTWRTISREQPRVSSGTTPTPSLPALPIEWKARGQGLLRKEQLLLWASSFASAT